MLLADRGYYADWIACAAPGPNIAPKRNRTDARYAPCFSIVTERFYGTRGKYPEFVSRLHLGAFLSRVDSTNISQPPYRVTHLELAANIVRLLSAPP